MNSCGPKIYRIRYDIYYFTKRRILVESENETDDRVVVFFPPRVGTNSNITLSRLKIKHTETSTEAQAAVCGSRDFHSQHMSEMNGGMNELNATSK